MGRDSIVMVMDIKKISDTELEISEVQKMVVTKEELENKQRNAQTVLGQTTEWLGYFEK